MHKEFDDRKGRYERAHTLYLSCPTAPDIMKIAAETGCDPATLAEYATKRHWAEQRTKIDAQRSIVDGGSRAMAVAQVDALAVKKIQGWFDVLANRLDELTAGVCSLPIDAANPREKRQQLAESSELVVTLVKAMGQLVEAGKSTGLVLGPKETKGQDKGLDLSKLTSLSLTLIEAQKSAGQTPIEPIKVEPLPVEPEY